MDETAPQLRLVAGLGNPGAEYSGTRHNIGFEVVDRLAAEWGLSWQHEKKWALLWAKGANALLVKPASFMNRSGEPLQAIAHYYKIATPQMLIVLDDMALPLGRLRLRPEGGTAGHNGLESVIGEFGTEEIPRLRVGIGAAPAEGATDYVLGRFFEEERPLVDKSIGRAVEAVKWAIDKGVLSAMNQFNRNPDRPEEGPAPKET